MARKVSHLGVACDALSNAFVILLTYCTVLSIDHFSWSRRIHEGDPCLKIHDIVLYKFVPMCRAMGIGKTKSCMRGKMVALQMRTLLLNFADAFMHDHWTL